MDQDELMAEARKLGVINNDFHNDVLFFLAACYDSQEDAEFGREHLRKWTAQLWPQLMGEWEGWTTEERVAINKLYNERFRGITSVLVETNLLLAISFDLMQLGKLTGELKAQIGEEEEEKMRLFGCQMARAGILARGRVISENLGLEISRDVEALGSILEEFPIEENLSWGVSLRKVAKDSIGVLKARKLRDSFGDILEF